MFRTFLGRLLERVLRDPPRSNMATPIEPLEGRMLLSTPARSSYWLRPITLPAPIQAEDFDRGGHGSAYFDTTPGNNIGAYRPAESVDIGVAKDRGGGYYVGYTTPKEWLNYTIIVPQTGYYDLAARVASRGPGGTFYLRVDGVRKSANLQVPDTGGWLTWTTMTAPNIMLPAGQHILRVVMNSVGRRGYVGNFNWFKLTMARPAAPSGVQASEAATAINVSWTDNSSNESIFKIERRLGTDGVWTEIATVDANVTQYQDQSALPNFEYYYRVRATNAAGDSEYSDPAVAVLTPQPPNYGEPLYITSGGVYSGAWESTDPDTPAIYIDTDEPVIIENSTIRSAGDLIVAVGAVNLTVRDTSGYAVNPDIWGRHAGRFVRVEGFASVDIENNYLEGTSGIYVYNYKGDGTANNTVKVLRNNARNIDGRWSDGESGWLTGTDENDFVQFFQINAAHDLVGAEIAWNQVINEADNSRVEDNISIHDSSGTPASPLLIHDNYIDGAYAADPAGDADYTGGGIMLSDNGSSWVTAYRNQVVNTSNYGIAISSGTNNQIWGNRIISTGTLDDGAAIASQNVGVYIWNYNGEPDFSENTGHDNLIGWMCNGDRNDWWVPDATTWYSNTHWSGSITDTVAANEWTVWQTKLAGSSVIVGPRN